MKSIKPVLGLGMAFERITEKESNYRHLDKMTIAELLTNINKEDDTVPEAVAKVIPQIEPKFKVKLWNGITGKSHSCYIN